MLSNKVRTYSVHHPAPEQAIYILNRGRNAGKPLRNPCPNCFIIYCSNQEELETVYWTFYALWKNGFFHPHLCGSVIEMLRLFELKKLLQNFIQPCIQKAMRNPEMIHKIKSLYDLEQKQEQQADLIRQLRAALVRKYYFQM